MPGGSKPGERRGGRPKGGRNKRSIAAVKAVILERDPELDSISLARRAAGFVLTEIKKLLASERYDPVVLVDWSVKLGRLAEGYIGYEYPRISPLEPKDRNEYNVQVQADLARLNAEQLIALKHLALIASGGNTETAARSPNPPDRPRLPGKAGPGGAGKDRA